ncbi:MAG TPA: hypothetical protein VF258_06400 [Luteolibacter sp.]
MKPTPRNSFGIKNSKSAASRPVSHQRADHQRGAQVSAIEKQAREYADALLDISQELGLPLCATPVEIVARVKEAAGQVGDLAEALQFLLEQTVDQDSKFGVELTEEESDPRAQVIMAMGEAAGKEVAA